MNNKELEGKNVYLKLKTGRIYTGRVKEAENDILKIIDKFGSLVYVSIDELVMLEVRE